MSTQENSPSPSPAEVSDPSTVVPSAPSFIVELARAARACTLQERKWIRTMMEEEMEPYEAGTFLGYSRRTIWNFLRRERVNIYRELIARQFEQDLSITRFWIASRYKKIANSNLQRFFKENTKELLMPHEWGKEDSPTVQEFSFDSNGNPKLKLHDKVRALDALAKYIQFAGPEKLEVTGRDGAPIEFKSVDSLTDEELADIASRGRAASAKQKKGEN
jgi:predicted DNA-binding protein (UPF0251 family)